MAAIRQKIYWGKDILCLCREISTNMSSRKAPRVLIQLSDQQSVRCKACKREFQYQHCLNYVCNALNVLPVNPQTHPAPSQNPQAIAPLPQRTIEDAFAERQQGKVSKDAAKLSTAAVNQTFDQRVH